MDRHYRILIFDDERYNIKTLQRLLPICSHCSEKHYPDLDMS